MSDEHLETVIGQGGPAVGLSPFMAPNPDLAGSPELLAAMREYVRSLRQ